MRTDVFVAMTGFGRVFGPEWEAARAVCPLPEVFDAIKSKRLRFAGAIDVIREEVMTEGVYIWTLVVGRGANGKLADNLLTWFKQNYRVEDGDVQVVPKSAAVFQISITWEAAKRQLTITELEDIAYAKKPAIKKKAPVLPAPKPSSKKKKHVKSRRQLNVTP